MKPIATLFAAALLATLSASGDAAEAGDAGTGAQPGPWTGSRATVFHSPYLPGSPVFGASPYRSGPVLGGVFYDGEDSAPLGGPIFAPAPGITCDVRRHACWTGTGIDRRWTAHYFGLRI